MQTLNLLEPIAHSLQLAAAQRIAQSAQLSLS
jgi:hypothetical protein